MIKFGAKNTVEFPGFSHCAPEQKKIYIFLNKFSSATYVHPLRAETPEDAAIIERGEKNKQLRLHRSEQSLLKSAPTAEEREIVHKLFVDTLDTK